MIKRIVFFAILSLFLTNKVMCQVSTSSAHLNNDSIKFEIYRTSSKFVGTGKIIPSKTIIKVVITDTMRKEIKKWRYSDWIKLLSATQTDWAANLMLYDIYEKDATVFKVIKTRDDWEGSYKKKDIDFWKKRLKNK